MKNTLFSVIPAQRGKLSDAMILAILYGTMGNQINAQQRATELSKEYGCPFLVVGLLTETSVSISTHPFGSSQFSPSQFSPATQFGPAILSEGYTIESESYIPEPYHIFQVIGRESIGVNIVAQSRQYVGTVLAINPQEALLKAQMGSWSQKSNSMLIPTDRLTTTGDILFCPTGTAFMINSLSPLTLKEVTTYFQQVHGSAFNNPSFYGQPYSQFGGTGEGSGSGSGTGTSTGTGSSSQYGQSGQYGQYPQAQYQPGSQHQPMYGGNWGPSQNLDYGTNGNGNGNGYSKVNYGQPQFEYSVRQTQIPGGTLFEISRRTIFNPDPNNREWAEPRNYTPFQIKNGKFTRTGHGWLFYQEGEKVSSQVLNSLRQGIVPTEFIETLPEGGQCIYISHLSQVPSVGVTA